MLACSFSWIYTLSDFESGRRILMSEFKDKYGPWAIVTGANAGVDKSIATTACILSLGEALYAEMKPHGVDVTVLSPGLTDTAMPANMPINFSRMPIFSQHPDDVARTGLNALGRKATVVSGLLNKFYAWENRLLPRAFPVALFGFLIRHALKKDTTIKPVNCSASEL